MPAGLIPPALHRISGIHDQNLHVGTHWKFQAVHSDTPVAESIVRIPDSIPDGGTILENLILPLIKTAQYDGTALFSTGVDHPFDALHILITQIPCSSKAELSALSYPGIPLQIKGEGTHSCLTYSGSVRRKASVLASGLKSSAADLECGIDHTHIHQ